MICTWFLIVIGAACVEPPPAPQSTVQTISTETRYKGEPILIDHGAVACNADTGVCERR